MAVIRMPQVPPEFPLRIKYPWKDMKILDQAIFPKGWDFVKVRANCHGTKYATGFDFRTKIDGDVLHVWRIS